MFLHCRPDLLTSGKVSPGDNNFTILNIFFHQEFYRHSSSPDCVHVGQRGKLSSAIAHQEALRGAPPSQDLNTTKTYILALGSLCCQAGHRLRDHVAQQNYFRFNLFLLTLTDHQTIVNVTLIKVNHSFLFSTAQGMTVD